MFSLHLPHQLLVPVILSPPGLFIPAPTHPSTSFRFPFHFSCLPAPRFLFLLCLLSVLGVAPLTLPFLSLFRQLAMTSSSCSWGHTWRWTCPSHWAHTSSWPSARNPDRRSLTTQRRGPETVRPATQVHRPAFYGREVLQLWPTCHRHSSFPMEYDWGVGGQTSFLHYTSQEVLSDGSRSKGVGHNSCHSGSEGGWGKRSTGRAFCKDCHIQLVCPGCNQPGSVTKVWYGHCFLELGL